MDRHKSPTDTTIHTKPSAGECGPLLHRLVPALGLFVLAPWVGEFLLGNIPMSSLIALSFLAPLYGGGALLIREVTRHTERGWPTMLLLGMAYGLIQAGLVDQALFNPSFEGHLFHEVTPLPILNISAYYIITFIIGHAVWSICIPIAIVELLTPTRRTTPWLSRIGVVLIGLIYVGGCVLIFAEIHDSEQFLATPPQMIGAIAVAVVLIVMAFIFPLRSNTRTTHAVPPPWLLGIGTFIITGLFFARPENWLGGVVMGLILLAIVTVLVVYWSHQQAWNMWHQFALVAGTLLTYAWGGFVLTLLFRPADQMAWIGNGIFALIAILLLVVTARRMKYSQRNERNELCS